MIARDLLEHPAFSALRAARDALRGLPRRALHADWRDALRAELTLLPRAAKDTLPWLLRTRFGTVRTLLDVVLMHASEAPHDVAFMMDDERMTWRDLAQRTAQVARVLRDEGVRQGDVVALLGQNSPTYLALLFGISRAGGTAALINNHLEGAPLAHALRSSSARVLLVEEASRESVGEQAANLRAGTSTPASTRPPATAHRPSRPPKTRTSSTSTPRARRACPSPAGSVTSARSWPARASAA
ncbi:MAG: AMP-binding protein [Deltaproteobacteria bacterium]|nr:AMP-binding protein [Deltaproteobacteria bacterium]